ncbi:hypothetical protein Tco_0382777 [Tanacetum coccineum]
MLNEGLQAFMDRFKSESLHIKGVPPVLCISAFMHGHGHLELAKKLNDKIPNTVVEMFEREVFTQVGPVERIGSEGGTDQENFEGTWGCAPLNQEEIHLPLSLKDQKRLWLWIAINGIRKASSPGERYPSRKSMKWGLGKGNVKIKNKKVQDTSGRILWQSVPSHRHEKPQDHRLGSKPYYRTETWSTKGSEMVDRETGEHSVVGEKVVVCNEYLDQPVIINDKLSSGYVEETLNKLRRENVKVDSRKCAFEVEEGKFLGHIVTNVGIRVDPDKVKAIMRSPIPSDPSQIRSLSLRLANIGRFIPKLAELMHPIRNVRRSLDAARGPN